MFSKKRIWEWMDGLLCNTGARNWRHIPSHAYVMGHYSDTTTYEWILPVGNFLNYLIVLIQPNNGLIHLLHTSFFVIYMISGLKAWTYTLPAGTQPDFTSISGWNLVGLSTNAKSTCFNRQRLKNIIISPVGSSKNIEDPSCP